MQQTAKMFPHLAVKKNDFTLQAKIGRQKQ